MSRPENLLSGTYNPMKREGHFKGKEEIQPALSEQHYPVGSAETLSAVTPFRYLIHVFLTINAEAKGGVVD